MVSKKMLRNAAIVAGVGAAGYIIYKLHTQGFFASAQPAATPLATQPAPVTAPSIPIAPASSMMSPGIFMFKGTGGLDIY